jgi:hypothetical protein
MSEDKKRFNEIKKKAVETCNTPMIYTNNVDNREYLFTDKTAMQTSTIKALEKMGDYDRDTHLMWLLQHKYIVDSYKGKALTDKDCEI